MLSATELGAMRAAVEASLPDMCEVQRVTLAAGSYGEQTESWKSIATVACRVAPAGGLPQERVMAERLGNVSTWTVTLPALTDVRVGDRLLVGTRTFAVAGVLARSEEIVRRVVCSEAV